MKPRPNIKGRVFLTLGIIAFTLVLVSWNRHQSTGGKESHRLLADTIPNKDRERKVRDLDEAITELDKVDIQNEMNKAMLEIKEAMKNVDYDKIKNDVAKAMKNVDFDKIKIEVDQAMKNIDYDKIKQEVDRSLKEVNADKIREQVEASMASIDWDKIKASVDAAKDIDLSKLDLNMKKMQEQLQDIGPEVKKSLEIARVEIEKTKAELKEYKSFVDDLDHDGLINKKEPYSIRHKDGKLVVNGKEVPAQVYEQYRTFLGKHPSFNIKKEADDFDIDMD